MASREMSVAADSMGVMNEEWRPVEGWEALYEVSDRGRVRSVLRLVRGGQGSHAMRGGRLLKLTASGGYFVVTLSDRTRKKLARVHHLVAIAFVEGRAPGLNVCHDDGDSLNNAASNLYWGTQTQNMQDKWRHGTATYSLERGFCKHGHPWNEANTYLNANGSPTCRVCRRLGMRLYYQKLKEAS